VSTHSFKLPRQIAEAAGIAEGTIFRASRTRRAAIDPGQVLEPEEIVEVLLHGICAEPC
jgi:hypothetical protein